MLNDNELWIIFIHKLIDGKKYNKSNFDVNISSV